MTTIAEIVVEAKDTEVTITIDDRRYRIRGLEKNLSAHQLRVNILATRDELVHMDTFDLCKAKSRAKLVMPSFYGEEPFSIGHYLMNRGPSLLVCHPAHSPDLFDDLRDS